MTRFLGEFDCKVDAKGRVRMPASLKKQLMPEAQNQLVVNRGFEKCLVIYPKNEWETISEEVNRLNLYVKKNRDFVRYFYRGATEMELDATDRFLLPKSLLEYAKVGKELVLFAYSNRIEVWDKSAYNKLLTDEPSDFADLAEEVMGRIGQPENDKDVS